MFLPYSLCNFIFTTTFWDLWHHNHFHWNTVTEKLRFGNVTWLWSSLRKIRAWIPASGFLSTSLPVTPCCSHAAPVQKFIFNLIIMCWLLWRKASSLLYLSYRDSKISAHFLNQNPWVTKRGDPENIRDHPNLGDYEL